MAQGFELFCVIVYKYTFQLLSCDRKLSPLTQIT